MAARTAAQTRPKKIVIQIMIYNRNGRPNNKV